LTQLLHIYNKVAAETETKPDIKCKTIVKM